MKKNSKLFFSLILFSFSLLLSQTRNTMAATLHSQDAADLSKDKARGRFGVGIVANYGDFSDSQFSGGLRYGANLWFRIAKNFAIELEGLTGSAKSAGEPSGLSKGKLSIATILIGLQGRLFADRNLVPFIKLGGGYCWNDFSLDSAISDPWNQLGFSIDENMENSWVYFVGAGIDLFLGKNFVLNGDLRYSICEAKGSWTITDQVSNQSVAKDLGDFSLNSFGFGLSLRFVF